MGPLQLVGFRNSAGHWLSCANQLTAFTDKWQTTGLPSAVLAYMPKEDSDNIYERNARRGRLVVGIMPVSAQVVAPDHKKRQIVMLWESERRLTSFLCFPP